MQRRYWRDMINGAQKTKNAQIDQQKKHNRRRTKAKNK